MGNVSLIDQLKGQKIHDLLEQGKRVDGRSFDEPRQLTIETGVIPKAEGSARVHLGDTEVVTGIKVQPDKPFPDLGDKGIFICTAEILPLAHPDAEPGPPGEDVIELARVVDRGIRESGRDSRQDQEDSDRNQRELAPKPFNSIPATKPPLPAQPLPVQRFFCCLLEPVGRYAI